MLTQIELENFKCFKERTSFPLGQLTLLTGINGCGKSTLLQSLLLMRQSIDHNENTDQILLNGSCVNLNSFNDVRNRNNSITEHIKFKYYYTQKFDDVVEIVKGFFEYSLKENIDDDMNAQIEEIQLYLLKKSIEINVNYNNFRYHICDYDCVIETYKVKQKGTSTIANLMPKSHFSTDDVLENGIASRCLKDELAPFRLRLYFNFNHIHYISADRLGPQEFYLKSTINKFPNVGAKGEFTVNLLYKKRDDLVNDKLCLGEDAKTLATQTEEWLNEIFNGAKVEVPSSQSNILELLFNTSTSKDRFRPANVGFGYSYILPIVVSGLIAKEGEILIVENPEAHLHPKAQSRLAKFLAKVSSCGVQVFIESHSDHILNALRIAVLDDIITHEDLSILYFQQNPEQPVVQIPVQANGGIEEWPEGFFDQMDKDFARLFGM
ncbi:DUF3696 domain-containing protein [Cronbergia sp. UHCC 0137]|uniref:DUF3696 domain-containing protein n=1 Tax=Cronbergia sp. UHCC 0137 TaxID=3110239 RepID=UPI002B21FC34|nr:DUF3696 domain-containing protein [Cronbergia sp. UHCC 0137]MEA5618726.1 DUF3696 domain-containing protein [Cronbergia sp. UHCC 0137]